MGNDWDSLPRSRRRVPDSVVYLENIEMMPTRPPIFDRSCSLGWQKVFLFQDFSNHATGLAFQFRRQPVPSWFWFSVALAIAAAVPMDTARCWGQSTASETEALAEASEVEPTAEPEKWSDQDQAEFDGWVEQLSSGEFAQRERSVAALMAMGLAVVEPLKKLQADTSDAEVRLRAGEVIRHLTDGDLQTRINDFLAGKEVDFDGWEVIRAMLGDSGTIRELFIELTQAHPALVASMEGTTRDRVIALEKAVVTVQQRVFVERRFPSRADTFALVLPTVDVKVPVTAAYESVMLSTLQKTGATEIHETPQLLAPFRAARTMDDSQHSVQPD